MNTFEFFSMQLRLQREMQRANPDAGTKDPYQMSDEELAVFITWNHTALITELGEALDECGWKPWASSRHINMPAAEFEMVDAWHFFMNMILGMGAWSNTSVDQLADIFETQYRSKNAKNLQRQVDGYDGVSTKCRFCHRELSEVPHQEGIVGNDDWRWCSVTCYYNDPQHEEYEKMSMHDPVRVQAMRDDIDQRSGEGRTASAEETAQAAQDAHLAKQQGQDIEPCDIPPEGWACSRGKGHEPPCAAYPVGATVEMDGTGFKDPAHLPWPVDPMLPGRTNGKSEPSLINPDEYSNPHAMKMVLEAEDTGEPLFCFRAKDFFSIQVLAMYAELVERYGPDNPHFLENIVDAIGEFKEWQKDNTHLVRYPD